MKKSALLVAVLFALAFAGIAFANNGPDTINLECKKGTVHFPHHQHQAKMECGECHHGEGHSAYKEGMEIHKCEECHNKTSGNKINKPMKAFHKNCKDCHKKNGGPTKCSACHKK